VGEMMERGRNSFSPSLCGICDTVQSRTKAQLIQLCPLPLSFYLFLFLIIIRRRLISESSLSRLMEDHAQPQLYNI
jgi:hypothetical protein